MIYESQYWKNELLKSARSFRSRQLQRRWHKATFADVERTAMIGFYSVRKLIEASKLEEKVANQNAAVVKFCSNGKRVLRTNWTHFWDHYDLANPLETVMPLASLCNQFIHSYVFSCAFSECKAFESLLVSSDRERNRVLYSVDIAEVIRLFESVGNSYPDNVQFVFNDKKDDYDVVSTSKP